MHQAWPKLLKRMNENKSTDSEEDRNLVIQSRTWFCLYLFEHQYVSSPCHVHVFIPTFSGCRMELAVRQF